MAVPNDFIATYCLGCVIAQAFSFSRGASEISLSRVASAEFSVT